MIQSRTWDITRWVELRRQLEEREERYRSLVEMVPVGISTVDLKRFIKSSNPVMAEMVGLELDEIVRKHFTKLGLMRARDICPGTSSGSPRSSGGRPRLPLTT